MKKRFLAFVLAAIMVCAIMSAAMAEEVAVDTPEQVDVVMDIPLEPEVAAAEVPAVEAPPGEADIGLQALSLITGVKASRNSYNSIRISWNKVPGATKYVIYRSNTKDGKYTAVKTMADKLYHIDTGLATGKTYCYKVAPFQNSQKGALSGAVWAKTTLDVVNGFSAKVTGPDSVTLSWNAVPGATKYVVYRSATSASAGWKAVRTLKSATKFKDTGLTSKTKYWYKVMPYRNSAKGQFSGVWWAIPQYLKLSGLSAKNAGLNNIKVSWNAVSGASAYKVYRAGATYNAATDEIEMNRYSLVATVGGGVTSFSDTGVKQGNTYRYKVAPCWGSKTNGASGGVVFLKAQVDPRISSFIKVAKAQLGKPYVLGGKGPNVFDCSGLIYYALNKSGYSISYMTSAGWLNSSFRTITDFSQLQAGDILCMPGHVGIYEGDGYSVEAANPSLGIITREVPLRTFSFAKRIF